MHVVYLAILAGCLLGTAPLEIALRTRVYARWRRLLVAVVPVVLLFGSWGIAMRLLPGGWLRLVPGIAGANIVLG